MLDSTSRTALHSTPPARHRFHVLDSMRGLAAIVVMLWHVPPNLPWRIANRNGALAVDFFFCLSGFVIAFSYEGRLQKGLKLSSFYVARFIRLYPVYLLSMLFAFAVSIAMDFHEHANHARFHAEAGFLGLSLFLFPNLGKVPPTLFPLNTPAWSLFFELIANLFYAFAVCRKLASNWMVAAVCGASLLGMIILIASRKHMIYEVGYLNPRWSLTTAFCRVALSFGMGILVFRVYSKRHSWKPSPATRSCLAAVTIMLLLLVITLPNAALQKSVVGLLFIVFVFPILTFFGAFAQVPHHLHESCVILGETSYPLYLFHMSFLHILHLGFFEQRLAAGPLKPWLLPITVALASGFSYLIATRIDMPVRAFLSRRYNAHMSLSVNVSQPSSMPSLENHYGKSIEPE
jgi:peptidoglycan/LPS O-acetylase OafA/YrhL